IRQSTLIIVAFFLAWFWNGLLRIFILFNIPLPMWLISVQVFWLGGVGLCDSWIWIPFIKKAFLKAGRNFGILSFFLSSSADQTLESSKSYGNNQSKNIDPTGFSSSNHD